MFTILNESENVSAVMTDTRRFEDFIADKVMGWTLWNGDWYSSVSNGHKFQAVRIWCPTADPCAALQVWRRCLEKAREMQYEISMKLDADGRFHLNGDHPAFKRLLVVDNSLERGMCRFAIQIFGLDYNFV